MAEREFSLKIEQFMKLIIILLEDGCVIAQDKQYKTKNISYIDRGFSCDELGGINQWSVKHPSFSETSFDLHELNNIHLGKIYSLLEGSDGESLTFYIQISANSALLFVSYRRYYKHRGEYVPLSEELKLYYRKIVSIIRSI